MPRKNIKVPEDLFNALRDDKDDQQSWPHYLEEQCLHDGETPRLESLQASVGTVEERTGRIERTLDELEGRMR